MDQPTEQPRPHSILIIEDDVSLLAALVFALEADGFTVFPFGRAGSLLSAPIHADCMVIDMRLPDLDGLTVVSRLRERGVWAPAILMTTNPDRRTRLAAEALGVQIVEKPLITGELLGRINQLIAANGR
jgi:two-component system response regulator FixJ